MSSEEELVGWRPVEILGMVPGATPEDLDDEDLLEEEWHDTPCDAMQFGHAPSYVDGHCTCVVCARCGHHTGNSHYGHYSTGCKARMRQLREQDPGRRWEMADWFAAIDREPHFCCPDEEYGCELEAASPGNDA